MPFLAVSVTTKCKHADSSSMRNVCLQGCYQACTGSAGDLSAGCPALPQDPLQGERHRAHGWGADILCAGLDQHPHVAQDRYASSLPLHAMPYVPNQQQCRSMDREHPCKHLCKSNDSPCSCCICCAAQRPLSWPFFCS